MIAARVLVTQTLSGAGVAQRLEDRGVRTFIPSYTREVKHARRTVVRTYPLFSTYIFAWLDDDQQRLALETRGCMDVLKRAGSNRMAIVSDDVIASLGGPVSEEFHIGDEVLVLRGRWKELVAPIAAIEAARVELLFSMLGQEMRVPVDACDLRLNPRKTI